MPYAKRLFLWILGILVGAALFALGTYGDTTLKEVRPKPNLIPIELEACCTIIMLLGLCIGLACVGGFFIDNDD